MRLTEFFLVIPVFVVILAVVRLFGIVVVGTSLERVPFLNLMTIIVLLGLFGWPPIARLARAEFLRLKGMRVRRGGALHRHAAGATSCSATSCRTRCRRWSC